MEEFFWLGYGTAILLNQASTTICLKGAIKTTVVANGGKDFGDKHQLGHRRWWPCVTAVRQWHPASS